MQNWEKSARKFIDECSFKNDIEVAFLTGSYAKGLSDEFSDVDLFIVLKEDVDYRERGNKLVGGFLIEYFANPFRQIKKYIEDEAVYARSSDINMILGGIVIYGNEVKAQEIAAYCKEKLTEAPRKMSEFAVKNALYHLWDSFDELNRAYAKKAPDFTAQFFGFVKIAYEHYSRYKCFPAPLFVKAYRWLTDVDYFNKFGYPAYGDKDFADMITDAFKCNSIDEMHALAKVIYKHVNDNMGGFDINNYVLRSKAE